MKEKGLFLYMTEDPGEALDLLPELLKKKRRGVLVSFSKPAETLRTLLRKKGLSKEKLLIVDMVSKHFGADPKDSQETLYLSSPSDLTELSILLDRLMEEMGEEGFLLLDSLPTMLLYNEEHTVAEFLHFLSGKTSFTGGLSILVGQKGINEEVLKLLQAFVDGRLDGHPRREERSPGKKTQ